MEDVWSAECCIPVSTPADNKFLQEKVVIRIASWVTNNQGCSVVRDSLKGQTLKHLKQFIYMHIRNFNCRCKNAYVLISDSSAGPQ